jgi:hypothetical protein
MQPEAGERLKWLSRSLISDGGRQMQRSPNEVSRRVVDTGIDRGVVVAPRCPGRRPRRIRVPCPIVSGDWGHRKGSRSRTPLSAGVCRKRIIFKDRRPPAARITSSASSIRDQRRRAIVSAGGRRLLAFHVFCWPRSRASTPRRWRKPFSRQRRPRQRLADDASERQHSAGRSGGDRLSRRSGKDMAPPDCLMQTTARESGVLSQRSTASIGNSASHSLLHSQTRIPKCQ